MCHRTCTVLPAVSEEHEYPCGLKHIYPDIHLHENRDDAIVADRGECGRARRGGLVGHLGQAMGPLGGPTMSLAWPLTCAVLHALNLPLN